MTNMTNRFFRYGKLAAQLVATIVPLTTSCSSPGIRPTDTIQELMQQRVDPSADGIWNAVETVSTTAGDDQRQPRTAREWAEVRRSASALVAAAELLAAKGRRVAATDFPAEAAGALDSREIQARLDSGRPVFNAFAAALKAEGSRAIAAIDARDAGQLVRVGGEIDAVCEACHRAFWYPNQVIPALPPTIE